MAMNTTYLGSSASVPANLNTSYISTGLTEITSGLSVWGPVSFLNGTPNFTSGISVSALTVSSTLTVGGLSTFNSAVTIVGPLNVNSGHTQSNFLSFHTTASATSLIIPDGAFGIYFESVTSCRLVFRSGNTSYTWIATTGAVL